MIICCGYSEFLYKHCRCLYIGLTYGHNTAHSLTSKLTDRIVRYDLDGTGKKVIVTSPLSLISMVLDDEGV